MNISIKIVACCLFMVLFTPLPALHGAYTGQEMLPPSLEDLQSGEHRQLGAGERAFLVASEAPWGKVAGVGVKASKVLGVGRIQAGSLKEFKALVQHLSKPGSQLSEMELQEFEKLTEQFRGKLRYDLNPVKGKILKPHVQVEGLGSKVGSRHIWLGKE